jgi:anaerobic magnesium-protoporphyrin IX monomethyl ester cyclase
MHRDGSEVRAHGDVRVLFVDLNNFARYPTVAVGYLTAAMRSAGLAVDVFSPLSVGVPGLHREKPARLWSLPEQKLRYRSGVSRNSAIRRARGLLAARTGPASASARRRIVAEFRERLSSLHDVVLISAYLLHFDACREIASICRERGVPVIVGGGYFSQPEVIEHWVQSSGATVFAGEAEPVIAELIRKAAAGDDLAGVRGVFTRESAGVHVARPVKELDDLAFPDYSDFPWHAYPHPIVPMITGRGCGWGVCSFCSDITSSAGRTYRSRSPENVLEELRLQAERHRASLFVFTDLKLNSSPSVWQALITRTRDAVPDGMWVGAVHVGAQGDDGLGAAELRAAAAAGLTRMTTGLESGSQPLLDAMKKGTDLGETARFLRDARAAGISVRTTMIIGHPGEQASDVHASADFLAKHEGLIDRVMLNRFALMTGTALHRRLSTSPESYPGLEIEHSDAQTALHEHAYAPAHSRDYKRAAGRLIDAVHRINRRRLPEVAREFDGVM